MTAPTPAPVRETETVRVTEHPSGYCNAKNHDKCPGRFRKHVLAIVYRDGKQVVGADGRKATRQIDTLCPCPCGCATKVHCLECKTAADAPGAEIDPDTWSCLDRTACDARRQARVDAYPVVQFLKEYSQNMTTAQAEKATTTRTPAAPKTGTCIHTGRPTKGGKFAPGQDAAYVSAKVASVMNKETTEAQVKKEMAGHGLSDALVAKFEKSMRLRREAVAKKVEAERAAAAEKEAAKTAKAG